MGYPDHVTDLNLSHYSFKNPKAHLIPESQNLGYCIRSDTASSPNSHACPSNPSGTNLLAWSRGDLASYANDQASTLAEPNHKEQAALGIGSSTSRWNPTSEQLLALEKLYRSGIRTPSAPQIQQIAIRLRRFGNIEGKNVFYWFQNHKARERQKRRRQSQTHQPSPPQQQLHCDHPHHESSEKKESGTGKIGCKFEQTNNKGPPPPATISKLSEHGATEAAKSGPSKWMKIQDKGLQQRNTTVGRSVSTWQAMELSSSQIYLINNMIPSSLEIIYSQDLCSFKTHQENITTLEDENRDDQTLELFPLGSSHRNKVPIRAINTTNFTPNLYFEFLPLKN